MTVPGRGKALGVAISGLKAAKMHGEGMKMTPRQLAATQAAERNRPTSYEIEYILRQRGAKYLIKWQGFEDDENSWEPYSALRHKEGWQEQLAEFLARKAAEGPSSPNGMYERAQASQRRMAEARMAAHQESLEKELGECTWQPCAAAPTRLATRMRQHSSTERQPGSLVAPRPRVDCALPTGAHPPARPLQAHDGGGGARAAQEEGPRPRPRDRPADPARPAAAAATAADAQQVQRGAARARHHVRASAEEGDRDIPEDRAEVRAPQRSTSAPGTRPPLPGGSVRSGRSASATPRLYTTRTTCTQASNAGGAGGGGRDRRTDLLHHPLGRLALDRRGPPGAHLEARAVGGRGPHVPERARPAGAPRAEAAGRAGARHTRTRASPPAYRPRRSLALRGRMRLLRAIAL